MNIDDFKAYIHSLSSHILFDYDGQPCGVDPLSKDKFDVWCGDEMCTVKSADDVMSCPIFNGKTLANVFDHITNIDY